MNIKKQVCTLKQAEKFIDLQIDVKSLFVYCIVSASIDGSKMEILPTTFDLKIPDLATTFVAPAFTSAELGVMLLLENDLIFSETKYNEHQGEWETLIHERDSEYESGFKLIYTGEGETEAESKADALIWMLENDITNKEFIIENLQN